MKKKPAFFCFTFFALFLGISSCDTFTHKNEPQSNESNLVQAEQLKNRGNYDSAILFYRKAVDFNLKLNQYPEWTKSISGLIDCYRSKGDHAEAMRIVDQALLIAIPKMDTTGNLYNGILHKKANLFSDHREFDQAKAIYNRNIRTYLSKSALPDSGLALTYNGLGTVFLLQNKYSEALIEYNKALNTYEKASHTHNPDYASSLQNIGIVYSMIGNYEKAEQYFLKSLKVNQSVLKPDDPKLASFYLNMGRFYQIIRNDSKAIEYMNRAENFYISQNQTNSIMAGSLFLNMGVVYIYTADYEKAQNYLNKSLEIISVNSSGNLANLLTIFLNMGFIAEKKGEYETARDYYLKGLAIGDKLPNSVKILRGLANVSYKLSDQASSNSYYIKALEKSMEMFGDEHPETALTYLRYGDFLSNNNNTDAIQYLNKSLVLYKKAFGEKNIDVSTAYYYIGLYHYWRKEYKKAADFFQNSLIAGYPKFISQKLADNPAITKDNLNGNLLNPLTAKSWVLFLLYQSGQGNYEYLSASADAYNLSVSMIEMLRSSYQDEDSKIFITGNEKSTFTSALNVHVELYDKTNDPDALEKAFSLSEKGKSAVLLSHLRDKEAKNVGRIPSGLLEQDASLKSELYFYHKQIHDQKVTGNSDEAKIKLWNSRIFDLSRKQDELIKSIEKNFPAYYNLKYDNSVITIDQVQKRLSPNQAIIEYTLTDSTLFTFAITAGNKKLIKTEIDKSFFDNLTALRQQLSGNDFNNYSASDFKDFIKTSYDLYRVLILPVLPIIKDKAVIIIPDGELGYLSFDVLLTSLPDTTKTGYKKLPYLIKESAISYAPSATTFFDELNLKNKNKYNRILAFGPDYGTENTVLDQKDENGNPMRNSLTDLTNTQKEIESLNDYFKVKTFIGKDATEAAFKKNASNYKVLHLAMHTMINNADPLYSKLIFFGSRGDTTEDAMLNASELINMELHAEMAVLSACNTGSGKMSKGEGIMSLSRDFFYAGVPGIVMTAWAVEDRASVKLMDNFYKFIAQGQSRNEALRLAKIEYLENCDKLTAHPHYWAAYMNVGDISPIQGLSKNNHKTILYIAAATMFLISVLLFIRLRRKKNSSLPSG